MTTPNDYYRAKDAKHRAGVCLERIGWEFGGCTGLPKEFGMPIQPKGTTEEDRRAMTRKFTTYEEVIAFCYGVEHANEVHEQLRGAINERLVGLGVQPIPPSAFVSVDQSAYIDCDHEWVDAKNEKVIGAEICTKCMSWRSPARYDPPDETCSIPAVPKPGEQYHVCMACGKHQNREMWEVSSVMVNLKTISDLSLDKMHCTSCMRITNHTPLTEPNPNLGAI